MSKSPPNPASTPPPKQVPQPASTSAPNTDEMDLAGAVDELLANIDAAGASLAQDLAADAPAPIESLAPEFAAPEAAVPQAAIQEIPSAEPAPQASEAPVSLDATQPQAQSPHVESVTPQPSEPPATPPAEALAKQAETPPTHEALLAEVDALLQQANQAVEAVTAQEPTPQPPPSPPGTRQPEATEPPAPTAPPELPQPAPTPAVATIPAAAAETILTVDEEVCRLADRLLEQPADGQVEAPTAAPAAAAAAPATSTPSKESHAASIEPEPKPRRKIEIGAAFATLGSTASPLLVKVLAPLSAPLAGKPSTVRQSVGWIACSTVFFSAVLWGVVLTRKPATMVHEDGAYDFKDGPPPQLPVAMTEESHPKGETAKSEGEHGEASSEHGEGAAKSDAHGSSKAKPPAKKPPRKNKVASKAKKPPPPAEHE